MKLDKEKFLKTEFGSSMKECITAWDKWLENGNREAGVWCQAQWEVYRMAVKHFFGVEYHFTRTDEYYGLCTEDESDWLIKADRELESCSKPAPDNEMKKKLSELIKRHGVPKNIYTDNTCR